MTAHQYDQVIVDIKNYVFHYEIDSLKSRENARIALLDAVGCAIETNSRSEDCKKMFGPVVRGSIIPNGFRLPGTSHILDPLKGSFDMGTAIRYLDHNDAIAGADWRHPSDNLGSILAVSDWLCRSHESNAITHVGPPLTMRNIIIALIKAYEIQGCMLLRNALNAYGLGHVILVKLASIAVVSWLMGLTEDQTMAAISQVWMDGQPLRVYRQKGNTIPRKGWTTGIFHAFDNATMGISRKLFRKSATRFAQSWVIENIIFKVMAVEGHGLSSIEASMVHVKSLRARNLDADKDISKILIRTNAATDMIINKTGPLVNAADRDHCLQYLVALTFLKGSLPETADFLDSSPWSKSSNLDALRDKIQITVDKQMTEDYMNLDLDVKSLAAGMKLELSDGTTLEEVTVHFPVGHGKDPRTLPVVKHKLQQNLGLMFSQDEISSITEMIMDDAHSSKTVSEFLSLLVRENVVNSKL